MCSAALGDQTEPTKSLMRIHLLREIDSGSEAEGEERDSCFFGKSHETGMPINWTGTRLVNDNVNNYQPHRGTPP